MSATRQVEEDSNRDSLLHRLRLYGQSKVGISHGPSTRNKRGPKAGNVSSRRHRQVSLNAQQVPEAQI